MANHAHFGVAGTITRMMACALLGLSAIVVASCRDNVTEAERNPPCWAEEQFCGAWKWLSTCGGFGYTCIPEEDIGISPRLLLTSEKQYLWITDDTVRSEGSYLVRGEVSGTVIEFERETGILPWIGPEWMRFEGPDTLVLDDGCCDMYVTRFSRMEP